MKTLVTVFMLALLSGVASAQPTFTSSDFANQFSQNANATTYSSTDLTGLANLVAMSGANQNWNFGTRTYTPGPSKNAGTLLPYPSGAPFANDPAFTTATNVIVDSSAAPIISYEFVRLNGEGFYILGTSQDSAGTLSKKLTYSPALEEFKLPLTYQTTWNGTSTISIPDLPPGASGTQSIDGVADGYGTLTVPNYGTHEVLRIRTTNTITIGIPQFFTQTTVYHTYQYFSTDGFSATIETDTNDVPTGVSFTNGSAASPSAVRANASNAFDLHIADNPVPANGSQIYYSSPADGVTRVDIMDVTGRSVTLRNEFESAGEHQVALSTEHFTPGTYIIRLTNGAQSTTQKIVIAK